MESNSLNRFAITYKAGDIIFCEHEIGDKFFMLKGGRIKLMRVIGDTEKTIAILQAGDFFGEMSILNDNPRNSTAIALEESTVLSFTKENLGLLVKNNPTMCIALLKLFSKRIYDQRRQLQILQLDDDVSKVVDVLLMLIDGLPPQSANENARAIPVNVETVANWAGLSVDSARHVLNAYVSQRKMIVSPEQIIVNNISELQRFINNKRKVN